MKLVYVFDAYCGWSHGFARPSREIVRVTPNSVEVVSGGLFTGSRRVPIREFGYVQGANAKIAELTGAEFGEAYEQLIADGSFVMDSEAAARGVAALRQAAPDRVGGTGHGPAARLLRRRPEPVRGGHLPDGRRSGRAGRGRRRRRLRSARARPRPQADFARAAELGVNSFPTLLAVDGDRATALALGHATADEIERSRHRAADRQPSSDRQPLASTPPPRRNHHEHARLQRSSTWTSPPAPRTRPPPWSPARTRRCWSTPASPAPTGTAWPPRSSTPARQLTTVFISHADPDFYFGAEVIADAFPDARVRRHPARHRAHPSTPTRASSRPGRRSARTCPPAWSTSSRSPATSPSRATASSSRAAPPRCPTATTCGRPSTAPSSAACCSSRGARLGRRHRHARAARRLDRPAGRDGGPRPAAGRARPPAARAPPPTPSAIAYTRDYLAAFEEELGRRPPTAPR